MALVCDEASNKKAHFDFPVKIIQRKFRFSPERGRLARVFAPLMERWHPAGRQKIAQPTVTPASWTARTCPRFGPGRPVASGGKRRQVAAFQILCVPRALGVRFLSDVGQPPTVPRLPVPTATQLCQCAPLAQLSLPRRPAKILILPFIHGPFATFSRVGTLRHPYCIRMGAVFLVS